MCTQRHRDVGIPRFDEPIFYIGPKVSEVFEDRYSFIINTAKILQISLDIAKNIGIRKKELRKKSPKAGIADAIIYETSLQHNLIIVTGDPHFKELDNMVFLT